MEAWTDETLNSRAAESGYNLELRGVITLQLIERWGQVAGHISGEDSAGRAILDIQPAEDLVERACTIADLTVNALESRGWIRASEPLTLEEIGERQGIVGKAKLAVEYERLVDRAKA